MKPVNLIVLHFLLVFGFFFHAGAQPFVSSFSPASGPIGSSVIITGINFSPTVSENKVFFGAVQATITSATSTTLSVVVPYGANYEPIVVNSGGLVVSSRNSFIVTYPTGGTIYPTSFHEPISFESGDLINDVIVSDIDLDGKPDILTANNFNSGGLSSFSVLRNTTIGDSISFDNHMDFSNGSQTYAIACGDLDGDGKSDVVAVSIGNGGISIFKNTSIPGVISFGPAINYPSGNSPFYVAIADFDWDGRQDIVAVNANSNTISIFRNTTISGNISFAPKIDLATGLYPQVVVTRDFNGDGRIDIAVTNRYANSFSLFRNTGSVGNISFAPRADVNIGVGNEPVGLEVCDISGDGKPELIVTSASSSSGERGFAQIFKNISATNTVSFAFKTSISGSTFASAFHTNSGDINGDGKPDLVMGVPNQNFVKVFQNNYDAGTDFYSFNETPQFSSFYPYAVAVADLNADGRPEIITNFMASNTVRILRNKCGEPAITNFSPSYGTTGSVITINGHNLSNTSNVSFGGVPASSFSIVSSTQITAVVAGGANGNIEIMGPNGSAIIGTFNYFSAPYIAGFTPTSAATGATITITGQNLGSITAVSFGGVTAASFTPISATQFTAVVGAGASGNVSVSTLGGTTFLEGFSHIPAPQISSFTPTSGGNGSIVTITGNNFINISSVKFGTTSAASFTVISPTIIEATVLGGTSGSVVVTSPGGTGSLGGFIYLPSPAPIITSFSPYSAVAGTVMTINGNNFMADTTQNTVYIGGIKSRILSASATQLTTIIPAGAIVDHVSVTSNYLLAVSEDYFIPTFSGNQTLSANSFAAPHVITTPSQDGPALFVDVDNDGQQDIITNNMILRNNTSGGTFNFTETYNMGSAVNFYLPVDLDGDGKKDLVSTQQGGAFVYVRKNNSTPGNIQMAFQDLGNMGAAVGNIAAADFDADGKMDIVLGGYSSGYIMILKNQSTASTISFATRELISVGLSNKVAVGDIDEDGKWDVVVLSRSNNQLFILRNTTVSGGGISFEIGQPYDTKVDIPGGHPEEIMIRDIDGDRKMDIAIANYTASQSLSFFKNLCSPGTILFGARVDLPTTNLQPVKFADADLDGDAMLDFSYLHGSNPCRFGFVKNLDINFSFAPQTVISYPANFASTDIRAGDLDCDGKPDLVIRNRDKLLIYKNNAQPYTNPQTCINQKGHISSIVTGNSYQWQEETGGIFTNLQNDAVFSGVHSKNLQIQSTPSQYGRRFRCIVDRIETNVFTLRLTNRFTGAQSLFWDDPANWSCGILPDENTDVILDLGSSIMNLNIAVASISITNYAYLRINSGIQLTITH